MTATVAPSGVVAGVRPERSTRALEEQGRARLRVADDLVAHRRRVRALVALGAVSAALSLFLLVAFSVFVVNGQFTLERLERQREEEQLRYEQLRLEVATRSAPQTIVQRARAMGLVEPTEVQFVEAPGAVPDDPADDPTSHTLASWDEVKDKLVADP
ncbi:MAG TPA: hypothetical protein VFZ83_03355 [Acidimicrobiia bacterium]|nr:hypothetical protein [Acidimicrobiia bacterium]